MTIATLKEVLDAAIAGRYAVAGGRSTVLRRPPGRVADLLAPTQDSQRLRRR